MSVSGRFLLYEFHVNEKACLWDYEVSEKVLAISFCAWDQIQTKVVNDGDAYEKIKSKILSSMDPIHIVYSSFWNYALRETTHQFLCFTIYRYIWVNDFSQ